MFSSVRRPEGNVEIFIGIPSSAIPARERPTQLGRGVGQALRGLLALAAGMDGICQRDVCGERSEPELSSNRQRPSVSASGPRTPTFQEGLSVPIRPRRNKLRGSHRTQLAAAFHTLCSPCTGILRPSGPDDPGLFK